MFDTKEAAQLYIRAHDTAVKAWDCMSKAALRAQVLERSADRWVVGGPQEWSKDELVNWLADHDYPHTAQAREVAYR